MTNKERFNNQEMQKVIPEINMKRKYLQQIISGEKTTEGRINSGPFKNVREGDKIKFFNDGGRYISALCEISICSNSRPHGSSLQGTKT